MQAGKRSQERWQSQQSAWAATTENRMRQVEQSREDVAEAIGVSKETIRNWLTGRSRVDPAKLADLAEVLGDEPVEYYEALGLLPTGAATASIELERLRDQVERLARTIGRLEQTTADPMNLLLMAATQSQTAVLVAPHEESVDGFKIHALDVISLKTQGDSELAPGVVDALQLAGCAKQRSGSDEALVGEGFKGWSHYARPVLNAPRPPSSPCELPFTSIGVIGTHLSTWATDTASLAALAIGYASTSVNFLSRLLYGESVRAEFRNRESTRSKIAERLLLGKSENPRPTVWASADMATAERVLESLSANIDSTLLVYLRPTDRLHDYISKRPGATRFSVAELETERQRFDEAFAHTAIPSLTLDVGFPRAIDTAGPLTENTRNEKLFRSMYLAARIVDHLQSLPGVASFEGTIDSIGTQFGGFHQFLQEWKHSEFRNEVSERFK